MSSVIYERDAEELVPDGLFFDLPAWGYRAFKPETR